MPKKTASYELALPHRDAGVPAYRWLYEALRADILACRLPCGARLPATRDLARQYGLARGTIVNAFDQLKSEGYVEGTPGSGTYVSKTLPEALLHVGGTTNARQPVPRGRRILISDYGKRAELFPGYEDRPIRAFRPNLPALDLFPTELWTQVTARTLRGASTHLLMGCEPLGYLPLRQAVAEYLGTSRGVNCSAEQVAIVAGVQEALDLSARLFVNPGDRVCMEDPGYPSADLTFRAYGANICRAGLDNDGLIVSELPTTGTRLVYVTPGHQFPLGTTMSLARRFELLNWARSSGALIFEDDYDSEYRYSGRPVPALQGLDRGGSVLYAGSFSKVLFPSLRLGYMVIPAHLLDRFAAAKSLNSQHAPLLQQAVLAAFIAEGHFGRHLRRMREIYAERLSLLLEEAQRKLAGLLEITGVEAGLQTAAWLCGGIGGESAATAAAARNVDVTPLSSYGQKKLLREGLQLGFAALNHREIKTGVENLAIALEGELKRPLRARREPRS